MIFIGVVVGLVSLFAGELITGTLAANTLGQMVFGVGKYAVNVGDEERATNDEMYRDLDMQDKIYGIYESNIANSEDYIAGALAITEGLDVDPYALLKDIGKFKASGDFESVQDVMTFDTYLRGFLLDAGQPVNSIDDIINEVALQMQAGKDIGKVLEQHGINTEGIAKYDGVNITTYDMQNYLLQNYKLFEDVLKNQPTEVEQYVQQQREYLENHEVSTVYHNYADDKKLAQLYTDEITNGIHYSEDGEAKIYEQYIGPMPGAMGKAGFKMQYNRLSDATREDLENAYWDKLQSYKTQFILDEDRHLTKNITDEKQKAYLEKGYENSDEAKTTTDLTPSVNQEILVEQGMGLGMLEVSNGDFELLNILNDKVFDIYSALVYPTEQFEYDEYDKHFRNQYKPQNIYAEIDLGDDYNETLNSITEQYATMKGVYSDGEVNQNNIMMILNGVKDDIFFNTSLNASDLVIDVGNENNAELLMYLRDLIVEFIENPPQMPQKIVNVKNLPDDEVDVGALIRNWTSGVLTINGLSTSILP